MLNYIMVPLNTNYLKRIITMKQVAFENFVRYVKIDTQSSEESTAFPSTKKQFDLAYLLVEELQKLGLKDASCDGYCYVTATVPANISKKSPVIGLFAHLDTSPEVTGKGVKPQVIENYKGGDIVLNREKNIIIRESENEHLKECIGHTLVTTDGTTLLGCDDKAGIAAIMTAVQHLTEHPEIPHGEVLICFTPDEETGNGITNFDLSKFNADFAFTVDGGFLGEINKETFSADSAIIEIEGRDMHPGSAKDRMVNSIRALSSIIAKLPAEMAPEKTDGYESYIHPMRIEGCVSKSTIHLLLRDFEDTGLDSQKTILQNIISDVQKSFPQARITFTVTPTYRNMRTELDKYPHIIERLETAVKSTGVKPVWTPIRGGTDGSKLTALGLPTPNIFTGGCNAHSLTEWVSVDAMTKAAETIINLVSIS